MGAATTTAIILGASAVAGAYSAKKQSDAAQEASNSETAAGDKALAVQERLYRQQREDNDPYLSAGRQALGRLGDMSGAAKGWTFDSNNPSSWAGPPKPRTTGQGTYGPGPDYQPVSGATVGAPNAAGGTFQPGSLGQLGQTPGSSGPGQGGAPGVGVGGPAGAQPSMQPQTVLMRSPDGETRRIPQQFVQQFVQRGGKVVQ